MNAMPLPSLSQDALGWGIVAIGTVVTLWSIAATVYWTLRPGETDPNHPKWLIMRKDR